MSATQKSHSHPNAPSPLSILLTSSALVNLNVKGTWTHVIKQRGMFSYTGVPAWAVARLKAEYHIYMLANGRISLAGLNEANTPRFAQALAEILGTN